jgi:hypothetical protein
VQEIVWQEGRTRLKWFEEKIMSEALNHFWVQLMDDFKSTP